MKKITAVIFAAAVMTAMTACAGQNTESVSQSSVSGYSESDSGTLTDTALDTKTMFSDADLERSVDLTDAVKYTLTDGEDINITSGGVYCLSGTASDVTVTVEAGEKDKVYLVLEEANIVNSGASCIYVKSAEKVFLMTNDSSNTLEVTGGVADEGEAKTDAVIYSESDIVLSGTGILNITSANDAVSCDSDLIISGGTVDINSGADAFKAKKSVRVAGGIIGINAGNDAVIAENDENDAVGFVYICGGELNITAGNDGIHAATIVQIDGGEIKAASLEGIEGTWVQINGGDISIDASDDGINASQKSEAYDIVCEINGGNIIINMSQGDTDAIDSNGNLYINGGTININAQSPFDYDGKAAYNGGTIIVNGSEVNEISNQFEGGPGQPGEMGQPGAPGQPGDPEQPGAPGQRNAQQE